MPYSRNRIAYYRDRCDPPLTQASLAQALGVHAGTIQHWERDGVPRPADLLRLTDLFVARGAITDHAAALGFWETGGRRHFSPPAGLRSLFIQSSINQINGNIDQETHLLKMKNLHHRRLRVLEQQAALYGMSCPPHIRLEIEDIRSTLELLNLQMHDKHDKTKEIKDTSNSNQQISILENPTPTRRLRIFLCHSSLDKSEVRELHNLLNKNGMSSWLDEENILPGQDWEREISTAVRTTDIVIVCLSEYSTTRAGYVQKEIRYALDIADQQPDGTIFIIPLKLQECKVPDRLQRWQWVNLFDNRELGYQQLLRGLHYKANELGLNIQ